MKTLQVLLALVLGVALGVGTAVWRIRVPPWNPPAEEQNDPSPATPIRTAKSAPKVVVDSATFDFGKVEGALAVGVHEFTFTNTGNAPLRLRDGGTSSPDITMNLLATNLQGQTKEPGEFEIWPEESATVAIAWRRGGRLGPFRETAKVFTNDPDQEEVTLTVCGLLVRTLRALPFELTFERASASELLTRSAKVFCYADQPLEIVDYSMSQTPFAKYLEVSFRPLSADELKEDPAAKSGVLATVATKPGLPGGHFQHRLVLKTNLKWPAEFTLPVSGTVIHEVTIVGASWDPKRDTLSLGTMSGKVGRQVRLTLVSRGPHRREVQFTPTVVTPNLMKVSLGEAVENESDTAVQTPLIIDIPPGSPSINCLGTEECPAGEIVIETTHPWMPKLTLTVLFAVEN